MLIESTFWLLSAISMITATLMGFIAVASVFYLEKDIKNIEFIISGAAKESKEKIIAWLITGESERVDRFLKILLAPGFFVIILSILAIMILPTGTELPSSYDAFLLIPFSFIVYLMLAYIGFFYLVRRTFLGAALDQVKALRIITREIEFEEGNEDIEKEYESVILGDKKLRAHEKRLDKMYKKNEAKVRKLTSSGKRISKEEADKIIVDIDQLSKENKEFSNEVKKFLATTQEFESKSKKMVEKKKKLLEEEIEENNKMG